MVNSTEGWIAASGGLYRFDGTTFAAIAAVRDSLVAVAAAVSGTSRFVVAVGPRGTVWHGDGTAWKRDTLNTAEALGGVCATALDEAFIAGGGGTLWRWDGTIDRGPYAVIGLV